MRFLVDECTGPAVVAWLRSQGHDVFSVYDDAPALTDEAIIRKAYSENRILITNDKDFGEHVYREHRPHHGIIFMRLKVDKADVKVATIRKLLQSHADHIAGQYIIVNETRVRFARD